MNVKSIAGPLGEKASSPGVVMSLHALAVWSIERV
jgi:hypothetical protein